MAGTYYMKFFSTLINQILGVRLFLIFSLLVVFEGTAIAQGCVGIPWSECQILRILYNETGGSEWSNDSGWFSNELVNDWYGIRVEDGHVTSINLIHNRLIGETPKELGSLEKLTNLNLEENGLSGEIPPELGNLENLISLYLANNDLSGGIPPELGNLRKLRNLSLPFNKLSGEIIPQLGQLSCLTSINLCDNNLSGSIPQELGELERLEYLSLFGNNLTGSIPSQLGNLTELKRLLLHSNDLSGEIPSTLGNLTNIEWLWLDNNELTGPIPPELSNLSKLVYLDLDGNSLSGSIPTGLGNISTLKRLQLKNNKLSGEIPNFLAYFPEEISLAWNCLQCSDYDTLIQVEDRLSYEFMSTQTVAPQNVKAENVQISNEDENRIMVSWDPIAYDGDEGGYQVYFKKEESSDYKYYGITADKTCASLIVSDLEPGENYDFCVETVTWPHWSSKNLLVSSRSDSASAPAGDLFRIFVPVWNHTQDDFTGIVVSNFSNDSFEFTASSYNSTGGLESLNQNPVKYIVGKNLQKSLLATEIFKDTTLKNDPSWIELKTKNTNKMGSIFLFGVSDTSMLDGAESKTSYAKSFYFTRPLSNSYLSEKQVDVQMFILNPTDEEITVKCIIKGSTEEFQYIQNFESTHTIPAKGFIEGDSEALVFPDHGVINGFMEVLVTEGPGAIGFSQVVFPDIRTSLGLYAAEKSGETTMYSAQLACGPDIITNLRLVNPSKFGRKITLTAVGDDGRLLADPVQTSISAHRVYNADLGSLFNLNSDDTTTTGSLIVEANSGEIIGDIIFAKRDTWEFAMCLQLQTRLFRDAVFNHISNLPTVYTGFAFFNPGEEKAFVIIEAIDTDGKKVAEKTLILNSGERIARTLTDSDIWPGFEEQSGGYIKIRSSQPIAGQQLFGDRSLRYMAAIPATVKADDLIH